MILYPRIRTAYANMQSSSQNGILVEVSVDEVDFFSQGSSGFSMAEIGSFTSELCLLDLP